MIKQNNNAIGYRRLSEKDQSKYSLEYQDKAIKDYCERNNLDLIASYTDNGEHSDTFDRPDYRALEAFIKKHKGQARYLIIMDHDRFSRNLPEALQKIDELESKYSLKVLEVNEDINLDPKDPEVFMFRAFKYLMANQELLRIRKRTKNGIRQAQLQGRYLNRAPWGYVNTSDEGGKAMLKIDDEKAAVVRQIFSEYLSGTPIFQVYKNAKERGFPRSGHSAIHNLLSNYVYAGLVKVNADRKNPEKFVSGLHPPIISEADYWLTQEKLGRKRASKIQPRDDFPLRGVLKCWCGKNMTAGFTKGRSKYYLYYRCIKHVETNLSGELLHQKFEELLDAISFTKEQVKFIGEQAKKAIVAETGNAKSVITARQRQLAEVEKKIDRLEAKYLEGEIEGATYQKWRRRFFEEKAVAETELQNAEKQPASEQLSLLKELLPKLTNIKQLYKNANLHDKHLLIRMWFKHSLTFKDGMFRTASINPALRLNVLKAKEKGLLDLEEPLTHSGKIPIGTVSGSYFEHLCHFLERLKAIIERGL